MAKKLLYRNEIDTALVVVSGAGFAQRVRASPRTSLSNYRDTKSKPSSIRTHRGLSSDV
jgi:hypothetical protein